MAQHGVLVVWLIPAGRPTGGGPGGGGPGGGGGGPGTLIVMFCIDSRVWLALLWTKRPTKIGGY